MNLYLNLLLISAHKNPGLELLVEGEFPTSSIYILFFKPTVCLPSKMQVGNLKATSVLLLFQ